MLPGAPRAPRTLCSLTPSRLLLPLTLSLLAIACGEPGGDTRAAWAAGASLLAGGGAFTWTLDAGGNLPPDVVDLDEREPDIERVVVPADGWLPQGPAAANLLKAWDVEPGSRVWEAERVARVRLAGERPLLRHEGRELPRKRMPGVPNLWLDELTGHVFWWRRDGLLTAVGTRAPGEVVLSGVGEPGASTVHSPERVPTLTERGPHPAQVGVGDTTRRAIPVPAPGELASLARPVTATTLHVTACLLPRAFALDADGRLLHRAQHDVPVSIEVAALVDGARTALLEKVLTPTDQGWASFDLDLTRLAGRVASFAFSARPLRDPGSFVPLVAWSDLTFSGGSTSAARGARPHVIVISLDTLRPDRLGLYGHERDTSPHLDAWAGKRAEVFDDALADSNWTLPSTATMITGLATRQHGLLAFPAALGPATPTLAERLSAAGYDTLAITDGGFVGPTFGFDRGFDSLTVDTGLDPDWQPALEHLTARGADRPVFVFLHTYLAHSPWSRDARFAEGAPPYTGPLAGRDLTDDVIDAIERGDLLLDDGDRAEVRRLYDAAVAHMDTVVGAFLERLDARLDAGERLVVVTSDHGELLFEHGHVAHGRTLYDAVLRVPLLVSWPGATPVGRSNVPAAGVDVVPTVLDVLGLPRPPTLPGRSLFGAGTEPVARVGQHAGSARAVVLDGWKLIVPIQGDGPVELYDLRADPGETRDLAQHEPQRVARLRTRLDELVTRYPSLRQSGDSGGLLDPELAAELRALGYLGDDG